MAYLGTSIETNDVEFGTGSVTVVPQGDYNVEVVAAEVKENSKNTGKMVVVDFLITEGEYNGSTLRHWINFQHSNQDTQRIGMNQLKQLGACGGLAVVEDTDQLIGIACSINVVVENTKKRMDDGTEKEFENNKVKYVKKPDSSDAQESSGAGKKPSNNDFPF